MNEFILNYFMSAYLAYSYSTGLMETDIKKSRKKSLTRRFKRRVQRLIQTPKFLKVKQEIIKFQKFSIICMVANPTISAEEVSGEEGLFKLFLMTLEQAWDLFVKIGGLIIQWFKNSSSSFVSFLVKLAMQHRYSALYLTFASCALLLAIRLAKKFGKKLQWYDRPIILILTLLATLLFSIVIKTEVFKTIIEWLTSILKSILVQIILILQNLTKLIDSRKKNHTQNTLEIEKPKPSRAGEFQEFLFFSLLTVITARYILYRFKRKLVGDGPFADLLIDIIDIDLSDYLPKRKR